MARFAALAAIVLLLAPHPAAAQSSDLTQVLTDVGAYVQRYLSSVQSIVGVETVTVQPIASDLSPDGRLRRMVFELRLDWAPGLPATVSRELVRVDGRAPRPGDEPKCLGPRAVSPEPLQFLLPENRERFVFTDAGVGRVDGFRVRQIDYRSRASVPVTSTWKDGCGSVDPGRSRGRIWVDAASAEVRRVDEGLVSPFDIRVPRDQPWAALSRDVTYQRVETSIRYRPVRFDDPEESILLPATIDSLLVVRNAASLRTRYEYTSYRRFVTGGRLVQ